MLTSSVLPSPAATYYCPFRSSLPYVLNCWRIRDCSDLMPPALIICTVHVELYSYPKQSPWCTACGWMLVNTIVGCVWCNESHTWFAEMPNPAPTAVSPSWLCSACHTCWQHQLSTAPRSHHAVFHHALSVIYLFLYSPTCNEHRIQSLRKWIWLTHSNTRWLRPGNPINN